MNEVDIIIGSTVFDLISRQLNDIENHERPFFRVKNLRFNEAHAFIDRWSKLEDPRLALIKIIVASDSEGEFESRFKADTDKSITYYRDNNESGLVYIETKVESDAQGLKNIFSFSDSNFLDGHFDSSDYKVPIRMCELAWESLDGDIDEQPTLLFKRLVEVLNFLHPKPLSISARRFAKFVLEALRERKKSEQNFTATQTDNLIGKHLPELGLFPDEEWHAKANLSSVKRRLELNSLHAELAGSHSSDLDIPRLVDQIESVQFVDKDNNFFPPDINNEYRGKCINYCLDPSSKNRLLVDYYIFEQLFNKDRKGASLSERIKSDIEERDPSRVKAFEDLNISEGIDRKVVADVECFFNEQPEQEDIRPLRDLISLSTLKMAERILNSNAEKFSNPFVKFAEFAVNFTEQCDELTDSLCLRIKVGEASLENRLMIGLFAFLYGETLREVAVSSDDDANSISLILDESLLSKTILPPQVIEEDDLDSEEIKWEPLAFEFQIESKSSGTVLNSDSGYEWFPDSLDYLILFWFNFCAKDKPSEFEILDVASDISASQWISEIIGRSRKFGTDKKICEEISSSTFFQEFFQSRKAFIDNVSLNGVSRKHLDGYFDDWLGHISHAKERFIPSGKPNPYVTEILNFDCVNNFNGGLLMLPQHPFRLRWLSSYLAKSSEVLSNSLVGELPLNKQNNEKYLHWIADLCPQQQPAVTCNRNGEILFSSRNLGLAEEYLPLSEGSDANSIKDLDWFCIEEISSQVTAYIEAHPYKVDGLSILIIQPQQSNFPGLLLQAVRKKFKGLFVNLTVAASRDSWDVISAGVESVSVENRLGSTKPIFPDINLGFISFDESSNTNILTEDFVFDISIVPQFLDNKLEIQMNTRQPYEVAGQFDPLLDSPTSTYGGREGGAMYVSLCPNNAGKALTDWSSLVVRQNRGSPVSSDQHENNDFIQKNINFQQMSKVFTEVHEKSHWVITLERYITREQIENLKPRPDILTVKEKIGSNGLFTLIVSSQKGREFITKRLERKLSRLINADQSTPDQLSILSTFAKDIYDETRALAPRLALKAMGISRVTEEIVGLAIAKRLADKLFPTSPSQGLVGWVSLDDHQDWFQGLNAVRADLLRFTIRKEDNGFWVDILVVEGKLRQAYDPHGEDQVRSTLELIKSAVSLNTNGTSPIDALFWREQFLSAIESAAPEARNSTIPADTNSLAGANLIPREFREAFRSGDFTQGEICGLYSICRHDLTFETLEEKDVDHGMMKIVKSSRAHLMNLISSRDGNDISVDLQKGAVLEKSDFEASVKEVEDARNSETKKNKIDTIFDASAKSASVKENLSESSLKGSYQKILDTFGHFNIDVSVPQDGECYVEGPASVLYKVKPNLGVDPNKLVSKSNALKIALALEDSQTIRFSYHLGNCHIDVPKRDEDRYFISAEELFSEWVKREDVLEVPIGVDHLGNKVFFEFSSSDSPHLLIGGTTGSGKSYALETILCGLVTTYSPKELRLELIDPKGTELLKFDRISHLDREIGDEDSQAIEILDKAVEEMQSRYKKFKESRVRNIAEFNKTNSPDKMLPWKLIVLDEYADLTSVKESKEIIESHLRRLAQKARAAGIHVIIATQNPKADVISTNLRSNLPAQLALRVKGVNESIVIMGDGGAETLSGKGDAFLKLGSKMIRLQVANPEDFEIES